jgi:hypothetical protein
MALPGTAPSEPFKAAETLSGNFDSLVAGTGRMGQQGCIDGRPETRFHDG